MTALVTSTERLQRLLALVPYVKSRKVVGLAETAEAFGISERELVDDLNLLWCVELRAPDPYCPIDLSYEGGEIVVSQAESMARPLRLAVDEASALLVALRMLAEVPGLQDRSALSRLIVKLEAAAGEAASVSAKVAVQVDIPDHDAEGYAGQIRAALSARRRVHLRYYVPGRDEATERDVDPMRLLVVEGRPYLEGWCLRAEGVRLFRLDRVLALDVLDVPSSPPAEATPVDVDQGLFRPSPDDIEVEFEDEGPGIPEEIVGRIFDPFFTTKPPGQGTGLGLAIAQGIVADHGGRIEVQSRAAKGSVFRVIVPVERSHDNLRSHDNQRRHDNL